MDLVEILQAAIAAGCGAAIAWLMDRIIEWNPEISPKTKRFVALALCAAVPTVLYLTLAAARGHYDWQEHIMAIGLAFVANQSIHGARNLPNGEQVREAKEELRQLAETIDGIPFRRYDALTKEWVEWSEEQRAWLPIVE